MTREELEKAINFRTIDAPCCGNCKWFSREYEDAECKHPLNIWHYQETDYAGYKNEIAGHSEHNICDRFERKEGCV